MKRLGAWLPLVVFVCGTAEVAAQALPGTTVQLPTFSFYSVGTTVSVPDRGSVLMGGINRASSGRNEFGAPLSPFRNSAIGSERSASNMRMHVWIHDFEAMDQLLLSQPAGATAALGALPMDQPDDNPFVRMVVESQEPEAGSSWELSSRADAQEVPPLSVAAERQRRVRQQETRAAEADDFFARGQQAEAEGKQNVAKIYYQMAARRATGELKTQVAAKLEAIGRAETGSAVVQSRQ
jgi:hypothetical protein